MANWDAISTPAAPPQPTGGGWDAVSSPAPQAPDMSGVQAMAARNLQEPEGGEGEKSVVENETPPTPSQQLDKALGMSVSGIIGNKNAPVEMTPDMRGHLTDAYAKGTAVDASDFMHSVLHSVGPVIAGGIDRAMHPTRTFSNLGATLNNMYKELGLGDVGKEFQQQATQTVAKYIAPFLSKDQEQNLINQGILPPPGGTPLPEGAAPLAKVVHGLSEGISPVTTAVMAPFLPVSAASAAPFEKAIIKASNALPSPYASLPGDITNIIMTALGGLGVHEAGVRAAVEKHFGPQFNSNEGPWAPTAELKQVFGDKAGKPASAVTDNDITQAIRMGFEDKGIPKAQDFHDTAAVMGNEGITEPAVKALRDTYKESNVTPDKVFADAQADPKIASDIREGKVPEVYKQPTPETQMAELEKQLDQESTTPSQRAAIEKQMDKLAVEAIAKNKVEPAITKDIDDKVAGMRDEFAQQRLASLNKKLVNGIALKPKEAYERELLSEKVKPSTPVEETPAAVNGGRNEQEEITPEHKEIEDKFGVPETMGKNTLARTSTDLEKIFADKSQTANLNDEQYQALEDYARRVEASQERLNAPENKPGGTIARLISDEAGSVNLPKIPDSAKEVMDDIKRDVLNFTTPMETGSQRARASAKDFANRQRWAQWNGARIINLLTDRFTPEELSNMWNAMDKASVHTQTLEANGMSREEAMAETEKAGVGHFALPEEQREIIKSLSDWAQHSWDEAKKLDMVEGEGLPFWTPRMAATIGEDGSWHSPGSGPERPSLNVGKNLRTTSANLKGRKYLTAEETEAAMKKALGDEEKEGKDVTLVRDIRTMPMALTRLEQAIGGRGLIDEVKKMGGDTGGETVRNDPSDGYFTIDHPSFYRYRPRLEMGEDGKWSVVKDSEGNDIFDKHPIYISKEFEGPLKAVLSQDSSAIYKALMDIKSKSMGLIMYSPVIHNAVEWGRALPAMPGKVATFKIYFEGNKVKNDPVQMKEAIDAGMVPIGSRFFNQDINSVIEQPNLTPGRSWTAKLLGGIADTVSPEAGTAVKTAIDNMGDFWHNTLLWDRVGDLQAGLYSNIRDQAIKNGMAPEAARATAAHIANRFAGALPMESMSNSARKLANITMFSRSFTIGNLGVMKDMLAGLPSDVMAQLKRDVGETEANKASSMARRKAISAFALDVALMYAGNSLLQDTLDYLKRDKGFNQVAQGYVDRFHKMMEKHGGSPWELLNLPNDLQELSSTSSNEPGKENRILWDKDPKTGTAYYMRMPTGKIGEEFMGWLTSPLDMARRKLSPLVSPLVDIYKNEDYFGHPVYDKNARGISGAAANVGEVVKHFMEAQIPEQSIKSAYHLLTGTSESGSKSLDEMKVFGPLGGLTFSPGYPGGPEAGILAATSRRHEAEISESLPKIKEAVEGGDMKKAQEIMDNLEMSPRERTLLIRHYEHPENKVNARSLRKFEQTATPEEKDLMEEQFEQNK